MKSKLASLIVGHLIHLLLISVFMIWIGISIIISAFFVEPSPFALPLWFLVICFCGLQVLGMPFLISFVHLLIMGKRNTEYKKEIIVCMMLVALLYLCAVLSIVFKSHNLNFVSISTFISLSLLLMSYPVFVILTLCFNKYCFIANILSSLFPIVHSIVLTVQNIDTVYRSNTINLSIFLNVVFVLIAICSIVILFVEKIQNNKCFSSPTNTNIIISCFCLIVIATSSIYEITLLIIGKESFEVCLFYVISFILLSILPITKLFELKPCISETKNPVL